MTTELAERRKGRTLTLFLVAAGLVAVAAITTAIDLRSARPDLASGPVVPGLEQNISGAQRIIITSVEATYRIERVQRGEQRVWVMRDRGDYPVSDDRVERLLSGLRDLRFTRRMTSDAAKHERLGVTDPREGGRGVLVQVEDARGALLVSTILGVEPTGLYERRPDEDQTWAVRGELPPLRDVAVWLDLQPLQLAPESLSRVEVTPTEGRPYVLARETAEGQWRLVAPAQAPPPLGVGSIAERLIHIAPVDVQPAPAVQGAPRGRVLLQSFDGLTIELELLESDNRVWLKLVARAANSEREAAALAMNDRVAAWAYALNEEDAAALARPLNALLGAGD